jgi:hypothetical protein
VGVLDHRGGRAVSVHEINLSDPTDKAMPPERVLNLSAVGDLAFVSICTYGGGNPETKTTVESEMAVSLPALKQAIALLSDDGNRERLRPTDQQGEGMPDLHGQRWIQVPL